MADWIIDTASHAREFPKVQHRHPNGIMDAVRDRTPAVEQARSPRVDRWSFVCPGCGDVFVWSAPERNHEAREMAAGR